MIDEKKVRDYVEKLATQEDSKDFKEYLIKKILKKEEAHDVVNEIIDNNEKHSLAGLYGIVIYTE